MPTQISGRVTLILAVLFFSLWMIFPTGNPMKPDLKPGIDMVGGTSLLYEIKVPPGSADANLSEQVMNSLKKRVDPQGVRNLIWRPQGSTRLEIQMPMTAKSAETKALRDQFAEAQRDLESTNIRINEATYAVEELKGEERVAKLKELGQGSKTRDEVLSAMASTWEQKVSAADRKDAGAEAAMQIQYDALIERLSDTNLAVLEFQNKLDLSKVEDRNKAVEDLKKRFTDFPRRLAAMDKFQTEYAQFSQVKDSIDDASELKRLLKGSGVIEFHILAEAPDISAQQYQDMVDRLLKRGPRVQAGDQYRWYEVDRSADVMKQVDQSILELEQKPDASTITQITNRLTQGNDNLKPIVNSLIANLNDPALRTRLRNQIVDSQLGLSSHSLVEYNEKKWALAWTTPDKAMVQREGQPRWALERAYPEIQTGERQVGFQFEPQGAKLFGDLTGNNLHKPLAIILDDKLISAPNINSQISASGVITGGGRGGFGESELNYMVSTLNAGALPAQLAEEPISEQQVGPQLGADNLRNGLLSCLLGLLCVAVFMVVYYHISGLVAIVALAMNMIMILGVMAALNATWTLPAVAGIVLTIGMSVDANVLVFERLREEQQRGLSLKLALRNAYDRAASAIIDSNAVTAITCLILYYFGSEEVKGFGLTLLIGLVSSLFTALFVTKTIFAAMLNNFHLQKLGCLPVSWPALGRALHPNVKWVSLAKYFMAASAVMIVLGITALISTYRKGELFDIEFSSGTAVEFELKQPLDIGEVRKLVTDQKFETNLPSPTVVAVGNDNKRYEVVTPSNNSKVVTDAVLDAMVGKLNLVEPSSFAAMDEDFEGARQNAIFPITQETRTVGGFSPRALRTHIGGVAIVLKDVNPKLSEEEIRQRLEQVRLQPQAGQTGSQYRQIDVQTFDGNSAAVIMTSDPNSGWDAIDPLKQEQWATDLAKPMWVSVNLAIHNPAKLQRVTNFNPQVAGEMQRDAFVALTLSLLVVMAYIWLRFGNLKYGTATVAAMLHDTILVIGFVGLSHWLGHMGFFRNFLLIEPFRVNLTLVAAVLTVMSYSMVDTIVVFDRIRENRGKFGHLDAVVINDSVNQTLSRTLLTVFTTTMSVFVMYVVGGSGIHGFTFVMLIGILIGTYSSFAIAAPILLIGEGKKQSSTGGRGTPTGRRQQLQGA